MQRKLPFPIFACRISFNRNVVNSCPFNPTYSLHHATLLAKSRRRLPDSDYIIFISVALHALFHIVDVKMLDVNYCSLN